MRCTSARCVGRLARGKLGVMRSLKRWINKQLSNSVTEETYDQWCVFKSSHLAGTEYCDRPTDL
jgi:hypothetical protein